MDVRDYARLLRRHWRIVLAFALLTIGLASALTLTQPRAYTATTDLFVSAQDRTATGDISSAYTGGLFTQQRVKSYVTVIESPKTAELVATDLGLSTDPDRLRGSITATAPLDQVIIHVSVTDPDPAMAQRIANSVGRVAPELIDQLEKPINGGPSPVRVSVVQPADLPTHPSSPRPKLNLALGLLVGLAAGVGAAVLRETLDQTVKRAEQIEHLTGAPVLGAIAFDPDASKTPLVVVSHPNSTRAEATRQLRTALQFVDIEHPLKSVVMTSSVPGEGKSTTACNLAITLAQAGLRVVLVEADLRRPRVADYLGMEGAVGLTSVLLGMVSMDEALQKWGNLSLEVLASGPLPPNPSELLGSSHMHEVLRQLEDRADLVLVDAPPLLPVTDAAVLGAMTSGLVLVVQAGQTRREQVARATSTIQGVGATLLGSVLNMVPTKGPDAYTYGYYYNYSTDRGKLTTAQAAVSRNARVSETRGTEAASRPEGPRTTPDTSPSVGASPREPVRAMPAAPTLPPPPVQPSHTESTTPTPTPETPAPSPSVRPDDAPAQAAPAEPSGAWNGWPRDVLPKT